MNNQHTPGPWEISERFDTGDYPLTDVRSISAHGHVIAHVNAAWMNRSLDDARLMGAAPDMLAACKAALSIAWEIGSESEDGVMTLLADARGDLYRQLTAAIAKAEGQS